MNSDAGHTDAASVERCTEEEISSLQRDTSTMAGIECAICLALTELDEEVVVLPCAAAHRFHSECARSWLARNVTCPLCRVDVRALMRAGLTARTPETLVSPRALGFTRDGGIISRYEPNP